jgi:hypothetical protein
MDPPLLASDDDAGTPLLSSGPLSEDENESSQMMTLLMQRPEIEPTPERDIFVVEQQSEFSVITILAGTLALLQCGLVWGAYLANSWSDTHLLTSIDWQKKYLPFLDDYTDVVIQKIDLGSVLSILRASHEYVLLAVVAVTAVGIPCLAIITNPMAVTKHYYKTDMGASFWDLVLRFSLVIIYLLLLLDLATGITLEWTDTALRIQNCMRGAMLSYLVGMTAAIGVVVALRYGRNKVEPGLVQRIPPAAAFRHPWPGVVVESYIDDDIFETTPIRQESSWHSCFTWQLGLATGVLLLPSFSLPLLCISYQGLAAEFMSETQRDIYLWQLPRLLWHPCDGNKWMVVLCEVVLNLQIVVLPLAGLVCGLALLSSSSLQKHSYRKCLLCLHPMMNGITLALTVVLFAPGLESMTRYLLNEDSSGLCEKFNNALGEPCLTASGSNLPGAWFLLAQSILLEVFCVMALSRRR